MMIWSELPESSEEWASHFENAQYLVQPGELRIDKGLLHVGEPLIVVANEIVIAGRHVTGGGSVALIARRITFESDAEIDTTGNEWDGFPLDVQGTSQQPGGDGRAGRPGGDGDPGGWVWLSAFQVKGDIRITARGGGGGAGENGENGGRGQDGAHQGENGRAGNQGSNGGKGSVGGNGGNGGEGGHVLVATPLTGKEALIDIGGGHGGKAGKNGLPGSKGEGSAGGPAYKTFENDGIRGDWRMR